MFSVLVAPGLLLGGFLLIADRMRPTFAVRVLAGATVVTAVAGVSNLVVFGLVCLVGGSSPSIVRADLGRFWWLVTGVAAVWTVVGLGSVVRGAVRYRRSLRAARAGLDGAAGVVVLPDDRVDAFAVPGRRRGAGCVVVTSGLRAVLSERECAVVVAHERAHLAGAHHRLMWLVRLAALAQPVFWPLIGRMEYLVERAADEEAARRLGDRDVVARAVARVALAAHTTGSGSSRNPGVGLPRMAARPGVVPRRVAALAGKARGRRWWSLVPITLAVATMVWTAECVRDFSELLTLASLS